MPEHPSRVECHDRQPRTSLLFGLVLLNIVLQLVNASLIKLASSHPYAKMPWIAVILAIVLTLGFARLVVWNAMHKRFPVSIAYPAMALFFPCLVVLAYVYGESVSGMQMAGACLVTLGVLLLLGKASGTRDPLEASS